MKVWLLRIEDDQNDYGGCKFVACESKDAALQTATNHFNHVNRVRNGALSEMMHYKFHAKWIRDHALVQSLARRTQLFTNTHQATEEELQTLILLINTRYSDYDYGGHFSLDISEEQLVTATYPSPSEANNNELSATHPA